MQLYVCVKHVPDTAASIKLIGATAFNPSVKFVANPYDEYGVEEAVKIVERSGGEVVVVTVGGAAAVHSIRSALAMGAARGILVKTDNQFLDSALTSQALKQAIQMDGSPDIIFTGKQSVDSEGMQTQYRLARAFDLPVASEVVSLTLNNGRALAEHEIGGGLREVVEMDLPCVIAATKGLNEPRYPKFPDIMKAKKKEIKTIELDDLDLDSGSCRSELIQLDAVEERSGAKMLEGDPRQASEALLGNLSKEKIL